MFGIINLIGWVASALVIVPGPTLYVNAYLEDGDGSVLCWAQGKGSGDRTPEGACPPGLTVDFAKVPDLDAQVDYHFTATATVTRETFQWAANGANWDKGIGSAMLDPVTVSVDGVSQTLPARTADEAFDQCAIAATDCSDIKTQYGGSGNSAFKRDCCFWHVNIHSCPRINANNEIQDCTPFISNTDGYATHTAAQALPGKLSDDGNSLSVTAEFVVHLQV